MVVKFELPQTLFLSALKLKACFFLERPYEIQQVAISIRPFRQEVQVIRHKAIGVYQETFCDRMFPQPRGEPAGHSGPRPIRAPPIKARGNKIGFLSPVLFSREPDILVFEIMRHGSKANSILLV